MAIGAPKLYHIILARVKGRVIVFFNGPDRFLCCVLVVFDCIIYNMDRQKILNATNRQTDRVWGTLCELRPRLVRYNPPQIKLNGRLWRTAGRCFQTTRTVDLGLKFFEHSREYGIIMLSTIVPHELIHQADFDLYGESEKKCGHGKNWRKLMLEYGLPDNPFHSMVLTR